MALDELADLSEERAKSNHRRVEIVRTHVTSRITSPGSLARLIREATYEMQSATRLGEDVFPRARSGNFQRAKDLLAATIPQLEEWADLGEAIRAAVASPASDDVRAAAEEYEAAAQGLAAALKNLKTLHEMYTRPRQRPPIDEERLKRGLEQARQGQVKSLAEVMAELRARRS
jgi:hypothetical protein